MKNLLALTFSSLFLIGSPNVWGQLTQAKLPTPTPYTITAQDANSRVWQRTDYALSPSGGVVTNIHSYTELCSGLNHFVNGKFLESNDRIDILPNGTAVATNCQHQASFPGDIHQGQIELVTPAGQHLNSRPLMLAYFDGTNTVVIAELTNSIGVVVGNNQVVYPNSFSGLKVDLQYYYTKSGFEQNIVLKEQPPTPESLGLTPNTARLQVFTEFFSPPQPTIQSTVLPAQAGLSLTDQSLNFGAMQMIQGRAFLLGPSAQSSGALVSKHWVQVNGRQFLVEEVPVDAILDGLAALPMTAMNSTSVKSLHTASKHLKLPPQRLAQKTSKVMLVAKTDLPVRGFVLDYQTVSGSLTNYTFQGDRTFYISGTVNLYQTNTFEGGAVLKYTNGASLNFVSIGTGAVKMLSTAYRPVIFTARDDNSVGETISGSTGTPTNYYANPALSFSSSPGQMLSNFRIACAYQAISTVYVPLTVFNAQIISCQNAVGLNDASLYFRNVLFANVITNFNDAMYGTIDVQNGTFNNIQYLIAQPFNNGVILNLTNDILANVTNLSAGSFTFTTNANYNGFYNSPSFGTTTNGSSTYPFQSIGAGNYYLTNGSPFRNVGSTGIDAGLLANIQTKTTYPPIVLTNNFTSSTNLNPQAQRDTDTPDLGYHYDPLDYCWSGLSTWGSSVLTLTNGVAIGFYGASGFTGTMTSKGTPLQHNQLVRYSTVQEQPVVWGTNMSGSLLGIGTLSLRFTDVSFLAAASSSRILISDNIASAVFQDCQLQTVYIGLTQTGSGLFLRNSIIQRSYISLGDPYSGNSFQVYFHNNLFLQGTLQLIWGSAYSGVWDFSDNLFVQTDNQYGKVYPYSDPTFSHNSYYQATTLSGDVSYKTLTNIDFQTGPVGTYYYPPSGTNVYRLIDAGSQTAALAGLYHYTTQTNQVKETNSIVDIGYHYVATDAYGNPIDSNGDGIPDYISDANGNGLVDNGESNWELAILSQPASSTVSQGATATFVVTAGGIAPLQYQWYSNGTVLIAGATNASLVFTNVQPAQAGNYSAAVSNPSGSLTSSAATLALTCDVSPSGIIDWWPAEGAANDVVTGVYGMLQNGVAFTNGMVGQAFNFNGSNGISSSVTGLSGNAPHSIEAWVKINALPSQRSWMLLLGAEGNAHNWLLNANGSTQLGIWGGTQATPTLPVGVWTHLAITFDGTILCCYINGQLQYSQTGTINFGTGSLPVTFGLAHIGENGFNGLMDEVSIYNRALSSSEVVNIYNAGSAGKCVPPPLPPGIVTQPTNQTVVLGGTATFSVTASGTGPFTYQWKLNGTNLNNIITTVAGNGVNRDSGDGTNATQASLNDPEAVAVDATGNLFIGENYVIRKVGLNGIITTVAGGGTNYPGDGGAATNANLEFPAGAVDAFGNLFIADWGHNLIRKVNTSGIITTVAGNGTYGYSGDNGTATNASLNSPYGIIVDASGNVFIADSGNNVIRKVNTNGIITTVAGNGTYGYSGDGGVATSARLNNPYGIIVDASGNLFIADSGNNVIRKVNTSGIITTVAGNGTYGYSGDGGVATSAMLNQPYSVAVDAGGNLNIADTFNNVIRKVNTSGVITTVAGNGTAGYSGDNGAATNASLNNPFGMAVDAGGNLWIADTVNNVIRELVLTEGAPALTLNNVSTNNAGIYSVVVSNACGTITSLNATLTVLVPPYIAAQPTSQTVIAGQNISINVVAGGTANLSYQWQKNGVNLTNGGKVSGANSASLTLTGATTWDSGVYTVVVSNNVGCVTSIFALLRVWAPSGVLSGVVAWGDSASGRINVPPGLMNVVAIAGGGGHSLALKSDGTVVAWGPDKYGQSDVPTGLNNVVAVAAGQVHSLALKNDGTVVGWGSNLSNEVIIPYGLKNVIAIAAGQCFSLALKADGTITEWGDGEYGTTNIPSGLTNVVAIAARPFDCMALKADGRVVAWGYKNYGVLNVPSGLTNVVAISAGLWFNLALKGDGTVIGWGDNSSGQISIPSGLTNVMAIAAGFDFSLALKGDGTVVAWGSNSYGQTSIPSNLVDFGAIAAGDEDGLALGICMGTNGVGLTNIVSIMTGDNPLSPWISPSGDTNGTPPNIILSIPANAQLQ